MRTIRFRSVDAVILTPALGYPAIVRQKEGGPVILEVMILCKENDLRTLEAAFHLRFAEWENRAKCPCYMKSSLFKHALTDSTIIKLSDCFESGSDHFGMGKKGEDAGDEYFKLKLAHSNVFPWILKRLSDYPYVYKISIDLQHEDLATKKIYNLFWMNKSDFQAMKNRFHTWGLDQHTRDLVEKGGRKTYARELKAFKGPKTKEENLQAHIFHPFYVTDKEHLNIGHVTDIHLDSRMELYAQSEASVIEVKENCPVKIIDNERVIENDRYHVPIKEKIANFNGIFTDICKRLIAQKADAIVITGDLVDYNRGIHTPQTYQKKSDPPGAVWDYLNSSGEKGRYETDRNWLLFYGKLLELYDQGCPVFTLLGNHDYVNYAMSPWPLGGKLWNGVFDQNLTLYESALCFGPGYKNFKEFVGDLSERTDYVKWYTFFINPFADFVVEYGEQTLFLVDWGQDSNIVSPFAKGSGGLHHASHLFKIQGDFEYREFTESGREIIKKWPQPFPIRNYAIYEAWIKSRPTIKMLFMHATAICPRDDISVGQINHNLEWRDKELRYGSFDSWRDEIIEDVEKGDLSLIVSGHSHRNVTMKVAETQAGRVKVLAAGDCFDPVRAEPKNLVIVTSSGGPLPKYIPGGPLICACPDKYESGWFYEKKKLFRYEDGEKIEMEPLASPDCKMAASKMEEKKAKRHNPGGNLLEFIKLDDPVFCC